MILAYCAVRRYARLSRRLARNRENRMHNKHSDETISGTTPRSPNAALFSGPPIGVGAPPLGSVTLPSDVMCPRHELKTLAIIPARGGSKGIPRKNVKDLCGKPLISYTIEAAQKARSISRIIVSTEDEEIAAIARCYSPDMALKRPEDMAQDSSSLNEAIGHVLLTVEQEGFHPDFVAILLPTHPFRTPGFIDFLVERGLHGHVSVRTCRKLAVANTVFLRQGSDGNRLVQNRIAAEHAPSAFYFRHYGLFGGWSTAPSLPPFIHEVEAPINLVDIDYPSDFAFARRIIENGLFDFNGN